MSLLRTRSTASLHRFSTLLQRISLGAAILVAKQTLPGGGSSPINARLYRRPKYTWHLVHSSLELGSLS